ncbi:MAG: hypothetical protein II857_03680 [Selenomonadaceae bacterium]|nr:hypothetical protein [Selenomonadaceae bacterium]
MIESYAGKEIFAEPDGELEKYLSPTIHFDWKNISLIFLPHQIKDLEALIEAVKRYSPDYVGVANIEEYKLFIAALAKYQSFADIKNVSAAVHAMTKIALQTMDEAGYGSSSKWIQLSNIFGGSAVPQEMADTINRAVKKMIDSGLIDSKRKLRFFEYFGGEVFS